MVALIFVVVTTGLLQYKTQTKTKKCWNLAVNIDGAKTSWKRILWLLIFVVFVFHACLLFWLILKLKGDSSRVWWYTASFLLNRSLWCRLVGHRLQPKTALCTSTLSPSTRGWNKPSKVVLSWGSLWLDWNLRVIYHVLYLSTNYRTKRQQYLLALAVPLTRALCPCWR